MVKYVVMVKYVYKILDVVFLEKEQYEWSEQCSRSSVRLVLYLRNEYHHGVQGLDTAKQRRCLTINDVLRRHVDEYKFMVSPHTTTVKPNN